MTTTLLSPADIEEDFDALATRLENLVANALSSEHSRRVYRHALRQFFSWYRSSPSPRGPLSKALVDEYRTHLEAAALAPSTINVYLGAVRKLATEAAEAGLLAPETAASVLRAKGAKRRGVRAGNWLTLDEARELLTIPDRRNTKGKRDYAILALLLGCALRRSECAGLALARLQMREARWVLLDLEGKGKRVRSVPVPAWVKQAIDEWLSAAGITEGRIFRAVKKGGVVWGEGLSPEAIWQVVESAARELGIVRLAPHDLRRTSARLCRRAGGELQQIQLLLGHASIQTTERYLGTQQELTTAVNDRLDLG